MGSCQKVDPRDVPGTDGVSALSAEFVAQIAGAQRPLYAYIRSLVGPWAEAEDVLAAHPKEAERFDAALRQRFSDAALEGKETVDPEREEALKALGYVN